MFVDVHRDQRFDLVGELAVRTIRSDEAEYSGEPTPRRSHVGSSFEPRNRAMISAVASHWRVSRSICFRPARVNV